MFASLSLVAFASLAVAAPIGSRTVKRVESAASLPTTTQTSSTQWYLQAGNAGACGLYSQDSDLVAGLPLTFYNDTSAVSQYCGSYIIVTNPKNNMTVTSKVADASGSEDLLSLSVASWRAIDGDSTDLSTVTWTFANATQTAAAIKALDASSSTASAAAVESSSTSAYVAPESYTEATTEAYVASSSSSTYEAPATTSTYAQTSTYEAPPSTYDASSSTWTPTTSAYVEAAKETTAAAASTTEASSGSSSSGTYSGEATFFYQGGAAGACGNVNSDSAYIVALDSAMYSSSLCGKSLTINGNGKSVTATVADECPGCSSSGSLDLSVGAFTALADESVGVIAITWSWN